MKKVVQKIVAGGVVVNNGKVLIIQRSEGDSYPGLWEIPGGKREEFEKTVDAVKREVKEETGIDVEVDIPVDVFEFRVEKTDEIRDATQISFLTTPIGSIDVELSEEHQNFVWISLDEIDNYSISSQTKETIRKAFKVVK
jgi:mutator protein MutT